jgi:uncharacterized phage protein gp47/JayE
MPFYRPTLKELIERGEADFQSLIPGAAGLRRSNIGALVRVGQNSIYDLYGYVDGVAKNIIYDTAELDVLKRHAGFWGVPYLAATFSSGPVVFSGTDGKTIEAGTVVQRRDGVDFATEAPVIVAGGTATANVVALTAGADGDTAEGTPLTLASPIDGVVGTATVGASGLTGGVDDESKESLLARMLARIRQPPHGGAAHDYVTWALEVPGVTRVWVFPLHFGAYTVGVTFVTDGAAGGPIPDAAKVAAVQAHIEANCPVGAEPYTFAPTPVPINPTIRIVPDTPAVRAAVQDELDDLILREAVPGGTILLSHLREAISLAAGETDNELLSPVANVTHAVNEMAELGSITWEP